MNREDKLALLKMTYGNLSRINNIIYLTKQADEDDKLSLINIETNKILDTFSARTARYCEIRGSKLGFVYTQPHKVRKADDKLKIYSPKGTLISEIYLSNFYGVRHREYLVDYKYRVVIELTSMNEGKKVVVYNREKDEVEEQYNNVLAVTKHIATNELFVDIQDNSRYDNHGKITRYFKLL